ncbi:glutaredoxin family protein [Bacillus alkalicellulosilyticus]|uniref:glutaredoxin family protein n=1 Tax=Alkalihalobacterium alkalicellulosilyticum TaxID=1912214 RepID=UPI001483351D|nr:glutaredoxin family protein [Bacillus alkalicellulosilyticus]
MEKIEVTFFSKENCSLCDKGYKLLEELANEIPLSISVVDIYEDDELLEKYQIMIPVVNFKGDDIDFGILSKNKLRKRLLGEKG